MIEILYLKLYPHHTRKENRMFDKNKFKEIRKKIKYKSNQSNLAMSNKYFTILNRLVNEKKLKKAHLSYAYSYLYLQSYLFRYTKYEDVVLNSTEIKQILNYNPENRTINYISKQGGILDAEGLTVTLCDFPIVHEWMDNHLEFTMLSHLNDNNAYGTKWRQLHNVNFNTSCKYPVLSFYGDTESATQGGISLNNCGGTYYNVEFTTMIPFEVFMYCMSHEGLGTTGFYIYCYIAYQNGLKSNCQMSINDLARNCNMSVKPMQKYVNTLRQYNLIHTVVADKFIIGDKKKGEANTHFHNEFTDFVMNENLVKLIKPNYVKSNKIAEYDQTLDTIDF